MAGIPDNFPTAGSVDTPSKRWVALTPHDSTDFASFPKAILVAGADGAAVVVGEDDVAVAMYFLRGHIYRIRPKRINSTGLGASMTIIGLY